MNIEYNEPLNKIFSKKQMERRIYLNEHTSLPVVLALIFLIILSCYSNDLNAAQTTAKYDEQATQVACQFDLLLLEARQLQNRGDHQGAIKKLEKAELLANNLANITAIISVRVQASDVYLNNGKIHEARRVGLEALELASKLDNQPKLMASVLNNWGTVLTLDKKYEDAMEAFYQGLEFAKKAVEPELAALILANLAKTAVIMHDLSSAEKTLYEGVALIERLPASERKAILSSAFAKQLQELLKKDDPKLSRPLLKKNAHNLWKAVQQYAEASSDARLESDASGNIGHLYELEDEYDQALAATRRALFFAQQGPYPEMLYRWQWQLGRLFNENGQKDKALRAYKQAVKSLNAIQTRLMFSYRNSTDYFQKSIKPVYYELAALYLESAEETDDTQKQQYQLQEARSIIEQMKAAEVEDFFQNECVVALRNKATALDEIGENSAVIYPIVFKDKLSIIVTLPSGMVQITSSVNQKKLTETVINFREYLQDRTRQLFYVPGKKLYHWVIAPLEEKLQKEAIDTLVIIPDEALSLIPFSALYDGKRFLIEKYAIVTTPGLQLTDPRPAPRENVKALLVGRSKNPEKAEKVEEIPEFPVLPTVPEELNTISEILQGDSEKMLDETYKKEALKDAIMQNTYRIIHMATHGEFSSDPNQTFLLTYDDKLLLNEFGNLLKQGQFSDEPVELLTLSACNTAVGDIRAAFGLAGIALESGARSAVATLWSVYDETTMLVMTDFYKQFRFRPDLNKAQALQLAQLNLLKQPKYGHPAYWSPFLFIGNWL